MIQYKNLLKKFIFTLLSIFLIIASFNYFVDAYQIFRKQTNSSIIEDLKKGYFISSDSITVNRIENIYDQLLFFYKNENIDTLAIGSSRAAYLNKELIFHSQNVKYLNFTTGTALLSELAKMIGLFNKHSIGLPETVIIGLDPWIFGEQIQLGKIKKLINSSSTLSNNNLSQLFNYEYTKINLERFFKKSSYIKSKKLNDIRVRNNNNMILSPNGDLYYPLKIENTDLQKFKKGVLDFIAKCKTMSFDRRCLNFNKVKNINEFLYFINYIQNRGSKVIIFLAPIAPTFYSHILNNYQFDNYYSDIKAFLKELKVKVIGDYNPKTFNLKDDDFIDTMHPKPKVIKQIFETNKIDLMEDLK